MIPAILVGGPGDGQRRTIARMNAIRVRVPLPVGQDSERPWREGEYWPRLNKDRKPAYDGAGDLIMQWMGWVES